MIMIVFIMVNHHHRHPQNRNCTRKETSDIYLKPRMIIIATSFVPFVYFTYLKHKYYA